MRDRQRDDFANDFADEVRFNKFTQPFSRDSMLIAPFGRLRVCEQRTLFESQQQYDNSPLQWEHSVTGDAEITHSAAGACALLSVTSSGDVAIRQTRSYFRYRPGKSLHPEMTFVMGEADPNVRMRVGYFDANNGVFFERNGSTLSFVVRSNVSGSPEDDAVAQTEWNVDRFSGATDWSGTTLDAALAQILAIDIQWLGVGQVRFGFNIDGLDMPGHASVHANTVSDVYMRTANLPLRYEVEAVGAPSETRTMKAICATLGSEGGFEGDLGIPFAAGNGATLIGSITTRRPIFSIRPAATFNSIVNRAEIQPESVEVYSGANGVYWELVYGGALTGASFAAVNASSSVEKDVAATAITGGITIASGFAPATATARAISLKTLSTRLPLTLDIAGANPLNLSVVATSLSGTATAAAALEWREIR